MTAPNPLPPFPNPAMWHSIGPLFNADQMHAYAESAVREALAAQPAAAGLTDAPCEKLLQLADRIDHEQLWRRPALERDRMTAEQRDRLDAGVNLRRYADLLGSGGWRIYPPRPGLSFRASTLEKVVEMARHDEDRRAALTQQEGSAK